MSREARIKSLRRDLAGDTVRRFIKRGIARLPAPLSVEALHARIETWAARLDVEVGRVQLRDMCTKWASCSSQATLTLHRAFHGEL